MSWHGRCWGGCLASLANLAIGEGDGGGDGAINFASHMLASVVGKRTLKKRNVLAALQHGCIT